MLCAGQRLAVNPKRNGVIEMQGMTRNVDCQQFEGRELIQTLSQCLDVIAENIDKNVLLWGDLFTKLNGVMVQLENK